MTDNKVAYYCPRCNYERKIATPGMFQCSQCGCKFKIDSNDRMVSIEVKNGKKVEVYQPNKIPGFTRLYYIIASLFLLVYGTYGLMIDDIFIPGKRSRGIHYHSYSAMLIYIVFLLVIANLFSVIIDHFDKRDNEINYRYFARVTSLTAWLLFITASFTQIMYKF